MQIFPKSNTVSENGTPENQNKFEKVTPKIFLLRLI